MAAAKRPRGRPSLSGETGERYQVTIPPTVADRIRAFGEGSLSSGIIKLAVRTKISTAVAIQKVTRCI